ncbi:Flp pilus assembly protein CpaB [Paraburkholderia susongensis]|uniref:Pilus assembly protein CpaB n=1 Tax=Paraburkholderia susongensis TaxID=1515439 RepID=A0A1X7LT67_9BURK|nr:Flp pilus assembly protein CpaB [Paraburkholderia susongensis]SMG57078.1 pilus assembly protein CpaB [Paraburkholderia susongensis]
MMFKRIKTHTLINNPWVLLGVAVIAAGLLTWSMFRYMSGREAAMRESLMESMNARNQVSVLVPVMDLKAGAPLTSDNFAAREVPADFVYDDTVRAQDFDSLSKLTLVRPVKRGTPVRRADISSFQARDFSDMLKPGTRALTIDIDTTNSADNMLKPGNRIDLFMIATPGEGSDASSHGQSAQLLLSDLAVIATGRDVRPRDYGEELAQQDDGPQRQGYDSVTLQVSPEQAAKIALAQKVGTLRAVLRNRSDKQATPPVTVQQASLFGDDGSAGIQYIVGGKGESSVSTRPALDTKPTNARGAAVADVEQRMAAISDAQQRAVQQMQDAVNGRIGRTR